MQRNSSGLPETIAAGLFCIVALTAIYRKDGNAPVCRPERVAIAPQPAAVPIYPADAGIGIEPAIKDMLLRD
jgi:hypothetical protein